MTATDEDFSRHLSRWGTHSAKWDLLAKDLGENAIALSVADMEFVSCPEVREAIADAAALGAYGYTEVFDDFAEAATAWMTRRHGWSCEVEDVHFFPRVVQCVAALVDHVLPRDDRPVRVVTLDPAYSPLLEVCERAGTDLVRVPMRDTAVSASIDWEALEEALADADLLLWTNPHNPTGRIWSVDEQRRLAELLRECRALVLSDDIHCDFERPGGQRYSALARVAKDLWMSGRIVHCASPGKTFNIAGLEATAICVHGPLGADLEAEIGRAHV